MNPLLCLRLFKELHLLEMINRQQDYEAAPFPIDGLTSELMHYLEPLPTTSVVSTPALQSRLNRLPAEIQEQIYQYLHPFTDPPVDCTRHLPPSTWKDLLFHEQIIPWLWDLDEQESIVTDQETLTTSIQKFSITEHDNSQKNSDPSSNISFDDGLWDWELLVRQLGRNDSFACGGILESLPRALVNRWRIWRLLDVARQDDVDSEDFVKSP